MLAGQEPHDLVMLITFKAKDATPLGLADFHFRKLLQHFLVDSFTDIEDIIELFRRRPQSPAQIQYPCDEDLGG